MSSDRLILAGMLLVSLAGCGDNLSPSGADKSPVVVAGSAGSSVTQKAPDFSVPDTAGAPVTLASALAGRKGIVLYFTMWCPICDSHMSNLRAFIAPLHPDVGFYLVDYVSGSVTGAASAAQASGYGGGSFTVLADIGMALLGAYQGTMGMTVVIDSTGVVRMNEDYRDGVRLQSVLGQL
jgi:peroxiredoxin